MTEPRRWGRRQPSGRFLRLCSERRPTDLSGGATRERSPCKIVCNTDSLPHWQKSRACSYTRATSSQDSAYGLRVGPVRSNREAGQRSLSSCSIIRTARYPHHLLTNDMGNNAMPKGRARTCGNTTGVEGWSSDKSIIWPREPPGTPDLSGQAYKTTWPHAHRAV